MNVIFEIPQQDKTVVESDEKTGVRISQVDSCGEEHVIWISFEFCERLAQLIKKAAESRFYVAHEPMSKPVEAKGKK